MSSASLEPCHSVRDHVCFSNIFAYTGGEVYHGLDSLLAGRPMFVYSPPNFTHPNLQSDQQKLKLMVMVWICGLFRQYL